MFKAISNLFDSNERVLDRYREIVDQINALENEFEALSDEALQEKTDEFKKRLADGETLDEMLPEAFAVVREASKRTLGMRHYDVQLMAGISFHEGKVSEQKTGEGKTLSATLALYLNALTGKGAHLVTVNDYLARRDAGWMAQIYHFLGISTAVVYSGKGDQPAALYDPEYREESLGDERLEHLKPVDRRQAYRADITYGTNNEFGFDYLRDNMVQSLEQMVQRDHHFAIVDEVDSILVDEARTPLIISAPDTEPTDKYYEFSQMVDSLQKGTDYTVDEKLRTVSLTDYGLRRLEKRLGVDNLYEKDYDTIHHVEQALKAKTLFSKDTHYVVKDGQVVIVDENTGRLMFGRRYSDGLHQAIEAKEGVAIQQESRTLATVSLQNYFRMYDKLAGMTGTAATEAEEFQEIYGMDVVIIPTNEPVIRVDHPDKVYKTQRAKYAAIVHEVEERQEASQPVLIGTKSIEHNDIVARYLKRMKIEHRVLNAKNHEQEALIIADAGKPGAVTVATNIAGRGVDIVLGGAPPEKPYREEEMSDSEFEKLERTYAEEMADWERSHETVLQAGGLHIIGTERHDSRRIDNQLRGRSGRQGDPGSSRFYVSLEDDLMRIFGGEQVSKLMDMLKIPEDQPIESGMVSKSIEQAQVKVEGFHFDQRKRVVEYDDVMNKQREIIYKRRRQLLEEMESDDPDEGSRERILEILESQIEGMVMMRSDDGFSNEETDSLMKELLGIIPFDKASQEKIRGQLMEKASADDRIDFLKDVVLKTYEQREQNVGEATMRQVERFVMLSSIDRTWMDHLDAMDSLREGIWLRGGKDQVLSEYKKEAFDLFEKLLDLIDNEIASRIFRVQVGQMQRPTMPEQVQAEKKDIFTGEEEAVMEEAQTARQPQGEGAMAAALSKTRDQAPADDGRTMRFKKITADSGEDVGRNDPCPCGAVNPNSGKPYKYKKCGLINAPHHKG